MKLKIETHNIDKFKKYMKKEFEYGKNEDLEEDLEDALNKFIELNLNALGY